MSPGEYRTKFVCVLRLIFLSPVINFSLILEMNLDGCNDEVPNIFL